MSNKEFDVIVYGATGYTGRLVAEYLSKQYGTGRDLSWAMAGRNETKLAAVRDEIGAHKDTPFVTADASNPQSLAEMAQRAHCIITTVGPYQLYGSDLVAACAKTGTDYVDLCGEPAWMHQMIAQHDAQAKESGARIVFSCGFDSIPFDLGVLFLQEEAHKKFGHTLPKVRCRVREMKGGFSGGTAASLSATMEASAKDPEILKVLRNTYSLAGDFKGPKQPRGDKALYEDDLKSWSGPFIMAAINTRNVHRSNYLMQHAYGENFIYDEMILTGPGDDGEAMAQFLTKNSPIGGKDDPKPGEGPTKEERETGRYSVIFIGEDDAGNRLQVAVSGDKDPGYGSTSKMIAESAVCLVKDKSHTPGGIFTTAPGMGMGLVKRLEAKAGLTFKVES